MTVSGPGVSVETQFRSEMLDALERELVGPDLAPRGVEVKEGQPFVEILNQSPTLRYSAGVLFPQSQPMNEIEILDSPVASEPGDDPDADWEFEEPETESSEFGAFSDTLADAYDETVRLANEYLPSAIGLSFLSEIPEGGVVIRARAARYESQKTADSKSRSSQEWRRVQLNLPEAVLRNADDKELGMESFEIDEHLVLRVIFRRHGEGVYLVTCSLLNNHVGDRTSPIKAADCFFQVGIEIGASDGSPLFHAYRGPGLPDQCETSGQDRLEEASLELLYRKRLAYAVGHGTSVDWAGELDGRVSRLSTETIPRVAIPPVEPRSEGGDEVSMFFLSGAEGDVPHTEIPPALDRLADDYEEWIESLDAGPVPDPLIEAAEHNISKCRECLERIRQGIRLLETNPILLEAFVLANRAILMQQIHSKRPKRATGNPLTPLPTSYKPDESQKGRWRSFQLAFILMNLSSIVGNPDGGDHDERDLVEVIWFPTGGGKTEAYLGLAATDIFFRRLTRPDNAGCTVLMRYTLRLLTAQQFQRASSMICACEVIRRERPEDLGGEPISIGLWVGESLTPNYRAPAIRSLNKLANENSQEPNSFQLLKCPWCGTALDEPRKLGYVVASTPKTVVFVCPERSCEFSDRKTRLPVVVIDEDVYATPPTLVIGTVDKFAMLAWREPSKSLFGVGTDVEHDPPDLIIQDELHLISGPLGSVVGMYETAIDLLCSRKGRRPKIVASTATIRRAWHQCRSLYNREASQFPPQGLDISDSFFSRENTSAIGRLYAGVFASASPSFVTAMVRVLGGLFQSCSSLPLPDGATEGTRDPYWTVLQYFSSLRELGHAATLIEADVPEYMRSIQYRANLPKEEYRYLWSPVEMTSRRTADEIPGILEQLEVRHPKQSDDPRDRPIDTLLATNMISVGVDVDRLGLMVVVGQPKTTSEYIQASSRVGRTQAAPGLVITMYNTGKPRDRSHYEHFRAYHDSFYRHVEPTSVTPFSLPVIERALHAVLVVMARHFAELDDPSLFDNDSAPVAELVAFIKDRCSQVDPEHVQHLTEKLDSRLAEWSSVLPSEWGRFGKPPEARPLMFPAGSDPLPEWSGSAWATPTSMRNVDVECEARVISSYSVSD